MPLVDFFEDVGAAPFDLLKLDIEGGEYAILGDDRFARLKPRRIALEWHTRPEVPDGRGWCVERLKGLGYQVTDGNLQHDGGGMLWAWQ